MIKKTVEEREYVDMYDLQGSVNTIVEKLQHMASKYGPMSRLEWDWDYENVSIYLVYDREETDAEATRRIAAETKLAEWKSIWY